MADLTDVAQINHVVVANVAIAHVVVAHLDDGRHVAHVGHRRSCRLYHH